VAVEKIPLIEVRSLAAVLSTGEFFPFLFFLPTPSPPTAAVVVERGTLLAVSGSARWPLNPVEYLWSHWKQHELPNFCPKSFGELSHYARKALRRMRRRPTLVMAFWEQAELFPL
jgi:hypothetical protein